MNFDEPGSSRRPAPQGAGGPTRPGMTSEYAVAAAAAAAAGDGCTAPPCVHLGVATSPHMSTRMSSGRRQTTDILAFLPFPLTPPSPLTTRPPQGAQEEAALGAAAVPGAGPRAARRPRGTGTREPRPDPALDVCA